MGVGSLVPVFGLLLAVTVTADSPPEPPGPAADNVLEVLAGSMPADQEIQVLTLQRSEAVSLQLVRVRTAVPLHLHERHTETVVIVAGSGTFRLGEATYEARPGDSFLVPPGTPHAFTVTSEAPAAAVTTFTPGFDGQDRVLLDKP